MPWNGPVPLPGSIVAGIVDADRARSLGAICARTQTCERLATVKAGDEPAWSSWPGVICLSTTIPETGARMTAAEPARRAAGDCARDRAAIDAQREQRLQRRQRGRLRRLPRRSAPGRLRAREMPLCAARSRSATASRRALAAVTDGLAIGCRPPSHNRRTGPTRAAGPWPTCCPSATKMRVTGPVNGDTTAVAWSLSKSTVPGRLDASGGSRPERPCRAGCGCAAPWSAGRWTTAVVAPRCRRATTSSRRQAQRERSGERREAGAYRALAALASSGRCHQPPPSAWNSAAVSVKRSASAWTRLSRACW